MWKIRKFPNISHTLNLVVAAPKIHTIDAKPLNTKAI